MDSKVRIIAVVVIVLFFITIVVLWKTRYNNETKPSSVDDDPQSRTSLVKRFNRMDSSVNMSSDDKTNNGYQSLNPESEHLNNAPNDILFTRLSDLFGNNIYN